MILDTEAQLSSSVKDGFALELQDDVKARSV